MTPERFAKISAFLQARQADLTLLTDGVHKGQNLSAMLRHCDAFAVNEMHIVQPDDARFAAFKRTCAGSAQWVPVRLHQHSQQAVQHFKDRGHQIVVAHLSPQSRCYQAVDYCLPTVIVMGSEIAGASDQLLAQADQHIQIPMLSLIHI